MDRPSKYLLDKVENMSAALKFFLSNTKSNKNSLKEKRLVFLAQIDFWEWEMETLIFSFDNFKERSQAWTKYGELEKMIQKHDILVKKSVVDEVAYKIPWKSSRSEVYAPIKELNDCIEVWNRLLAACEELLNPYSEQMVQLGGKFHANLDKFRKKHLEELVCHVQ